MDIHKFSKRMIELMPQCIRGFSRHESNHLSRGKITMPQFWVLEYLSRKGERGMSELAAFLNISRPAATGLINRLIAQRLVSREDVEHDRREVRVKITPKGKRIVANVWEQKRHTLIRVFSKLSARDRAQHLMILERVVGILCQTPVVKRPLARGFGKRLNSVIIIGTFFLSLGSVQISRAAEERLTLQQCYQLALKQSEKVALQKELIEEAKAHFLQAVSGMLPDLAFEYSEQYQHGPGGSNFTLREAPEGKFTASQSLFAGFKEIAAVKAGKAERRQRELELRRARQILFTDVSDAFYQFLSYQQEMAALDTTKTALNERLQELGKRVELGRSRPSEVASAEAQLRHIESDWELLFSEQEIFRQLLEFLTGGTVYAVADEDQEEIKLDGEEYFISKAGGRPDVLAAKEAVTVANSLVAVERAELLPKATLDANYYTKRVGNAKSVDWDVTPKVEVAILNGTETIGAVKLARSQANAAAIQLQLAERNARLEILNAYTRLKALQTRNKALEKALAAAEKSYNLQLEDYGLNLVNNLEVLQALADLQDRRREFIATNSELKRALWNLKVAIGEIDQ